MARTQTNNSSQYLMFSGTPPVTAAPLTMACWYLPTSAPSDVDVLMQIKAFATAANRDCWTLQVDSADTLTATTGSGAGASSSTSAGTVSAGVWAHCAGVYGSATSRIAYLNAVAATPQTTSRVPDLVDVLSVAIGTASSGLNSPAKGAFAEAAVWSVALAADEIAALAKGWSPLLIRPASLVAYWPIRGNLSPEPDLVGTYPLTITGTLPKADHCRVIYPARWQVGPSAAGPTVVPITGEAATGSAGTLVAVGSALVAITGEAATGSPGTLVATALETAAITGNAATGAAGDLTATGEAFVPVTGAVGTGAAGTLVGVGGALVPVTGNEAAGAAGDLTAIGGALVPITGEAGTGEVGTVVAFADVTLDLDGTGAIGDAGALIVDAVGETQIMGTQTMGAAGDLVAVADFAQDITGTEATGEAGTLDATIGTAPPITGNGAVGAVGDLATIFDMAVPIIGVSGFGDAGDLTAGEVVVGPSVPPGIYAPQPVNVGSLMIR